MNYSTTFRSLLAAIILLYTCSLFALPVYADQAIEREAPLIPLGDILVVYSDGASEEEVAAVSDLVEILTYQSFQVSYGTASQSVGDIEDFDYIICYEVKKYPARFLNQLIEQRNNGKKFFFIGNDLIRQYVDQIGKSVLDCDYVTEKKSVGRITYSFDESALQEGLAKEDGFFFFTKGMDEEYGIVEVGEQTGYVIANNRTLTHMSVGDMDDPMVKAIFAKEAAKWKWPYDSEQHVYAQYIVLNEVYPFEDTEKLLEIVNLLIREQEPFVISVMPVYVNENYPAMQKFCEVLRYAQANGGAIIMHSPINQMTSLDADLVNEYMTLALQNYMNQGVYPIGLQAPVEWMFDAQGIEVLSRFGTIFTIEDDDPATFSEKIHSNEIYKDGHQWVGPAIALDNSGVSYTKTYSTAVYLDFTDDLSVIENQIHACQDSFVPLKSLWDVDHTFWSNEDLLLYRNGILTVNNERKERTYEPVTISENFAYNRNTLKRFSKNLASENQKLVVIVVIVSILFIFFLYSARHNNKQKFFFHDKKEE